VNTPDNDALDAAILAAVSTKGARASVSPSQVAILLAGETAGWQALLPKIRARAVALMEAGKIEILRKGKPVADAGDVRGVIRLRAAP